MSSYIDSPRFAQYALTVKAAIERIYRQTKVGVTIAQIKRELGENLRDEWLADSLDALAGVQSIKQTSYISPVRYEPSAARIKEKKGWNTSISTTGHKGPDPTAIFGREKG